MEFEIQYLSVNTYEDFVNEAVFEFCVTPCSDATQMATPFFTSNSLGEPDFVYKNEFGFDLVRIRTTKPFKEFSFTLKAKVQKNDHEFPPYTSLSIEEETAQFSSYDFYIDHHWFLRQTFFTNLSPLNLSKVMKYKGDQHIFQFLTGVTSYIYTQIKYKKDTTDVTSTADQLLKTKSGVCQDFTHLFIAIARNSGIPCRYVSGYLNQTGDFVGALLMHAWAEALVPGAGWVGFDPTNNLLADSNYIKVSHGLDYNDCSPIKGVLMTKGQNTTTYQVKVMPQ